MNPHGPDEWNDVKTAFICLGVSLLQSTKPIYAHRFEIEAVLRLAQAPPDTSSIEIDWENVKSRLHIASTETDQNKEWWKEQQSK